MTIRCYPKIFESYYGSGSIKPVTSFSFLMPGSDQENRVVGGKTILNRRHCNGRKRKC